MTETTTTRTSSTGIGASVLRPDGTPKVTGDFAYSSDLWLDDMLWGATLRSPHPRARINSIDLGPALAVAGVYAVLTHDDVPGRKKYGLEIIDQPGVMSTLTKVIGQAGGNIMDITHHRLFIDLPVKRAEVDVLVETRNAKHVSEIIEMLEQTGFSTRRLSSQSGQD